MVKRTIENFSMAQICDSGECFRMTPIDESTYSVIASGRYLEVEQHGTECIFSCDEA